MENIPPIDPEASARALADILPKLDSARNDLLTLHRVLLQAERVRYEKVFGRIQGNGEFLQLAMNDPWFIWLRPMMRLVSEIDSRLLDRGQPPMTAEDAAQMLSEARRLLRPDSAGSGFQQEFQQLLQDSPEVAVIHRQLVRERE